MKIFKVLVDELPERCGECKLWNLIDGDSDPICIPTNVYVDCDDKPLSICPLQYAPHWEASYRESGIIKP